MFFAMWSGPRNLSTALMYAFANHPDVNVWDEPFYAAYLAQTGENHPMRDDVLGSQPNDELDVIKDLQDPTQRTKKHSYFKLMTHHMLDHWPLDWAKDCVNIHLIRHPARVIASYAAKRENPTLNDIGIAQQLRLAQTLPGPVIDSNDIRNDPEGSLRNLCKTIGLDYNSAMVLWSAGPRPFDGVWASHWYGAVHQSTGFAGPEGPLPTLSGANADTLAAALPYYEKLKALC